jgi:hypothetical protein
MKWSKWSLVLVTSFLAATSAWAGTAKEPGKISWKTIVVDRSFRSEGVAVADVNKDGKNDILVGDIWYEAPDWKIHVIRQDRKFDPLNYSQTFACWADDINKDGWPDLIVVGFPGAPCHWYENPQNKPGPWKEHEIWHSACNETPLYADLFGTGQRVLVMGWQPKGQERMGQMACFAPGDDPTKTWVMRPISVPSEKGKEVPGTFKYSHGLGVGDVNGDGRQDVITTGGWWEQPGKVTDAPWVFHKADLGPNCADMVVYDLDKDKTPDIITSSAHAFGIWWHRQTPGKDGSAFVKRDLFDKLFSQSHALHSVDINGDGLKDLVTGRRWWAHGPKGDPGSDGPAVLYWFEAIRASDGTVRFEPHQIHDDSGIGTQFVVMDFDGDGLPDIVVSNKKGVFVTLQVRGGASPGRQIED